LTLSEKKEKQIWNVFEKKRKSERFCPLFSPARMNLAEGGKEKKAKGHLEKKKRVASSPPPRKVHGKQEGKKRKGGE